MSLQRKRHEWIRFDNGGILRCSRCSWLKRKEGKKSWYMLNLPGHDWRQHNPTHDLVPGCK